MMNDLEILWPKLLDLGLKQMSIELTEAQHQQLLKHLVLLKSWSQAFNLTAVVESDWVARHVLDSLVLLPFLSPGCWLDVGSGAGFPGVPLAIAAPELSFVLLDSRLKKTRFLQTVVQELQLKQTKVAQERAEIYQPIQSLTGVISRACADVEKMLTMTSHLLAPQGRWVLMLGQAPQALPEISNITMQLHTVVVPGIDAKRHVLEIAQGLQG